MKRAPLAFFVLIACLTAGAAPATRPSIESRCHALLASWNDRFAEERFHAIVSPPFVIAGDGDMHKLEGYRDRTILAASRGLRATYFDVEPSEPILILLFESAEPYKRLAKKWFDDDDVPHFGFCRADGTMLMNISTGGGTLVHELVHALIKPDFPQVPAWFNEGLGSLYEQCRLDGDRIVGLKNWRLPALKQAIREETLRPLSELLADRHFYDPQHVGLNYAQARYLLMYLQEKGLLTDYYRAFRAAVKEDPTGEKTLRTLIAPQSLQEFERDWRSWVTAL